MNVFITTAISTLTGFVIGFVIRKSKQVYGKNQNEKTTFQALLRNAITSKYYVYTELGHIPDYERQNLVYLYEEYKKWNGNSYVSQIINEILKLPIKDDD